jgi:hypothetical protein
MIRAHHPAYFIKVGDPMALFSRAVISSTIIHRTHLYRAHFNFASRNTMSSIPAEKKAIAITKAS